MIYLMNKMNFIILTESLYPMTRISQSFKAAVYNHM